ncbi:MAG: UbiA family prenyltransferase [Candidatus Helarchaeota archaeon]
MNRIELLRLDYLFSVIVPCLLAIYLNNLNILDNNYLGIIFGWAFIGITGNLLNDAIDKDRDIDYTSKELGTIAIVSFILGITLMVETFLAAPLTIVFALSSIFLVIAYCVKLKQYAIINKFVLVFSHIVFPYLMIRIQAPPPPMGWGEILLLMTFLAFSFSSQVIHEHIDKEAIQSYSHRQIQIIVQISSVLTIILGLFSLILLNNYFLLPFIIVPIGPIYIYRKPRPPGLHVKDVGIIIGNLIMVYIIILIFN